MTDSQRETGHATKLRPGAYFYHFIGLSNLGRGHDFPAVYATSEAEAAAIVANQFILLVNPPLNERHQLHIRRENGHTRDYWFDGSGRIFTRSNVDVTPRKVSAA